MARDEDPTRGEVKAAVALVVRGVPEKHTEGGTGCELVRSSGSGVRVASTPEDTEVGGGGPGRSWSGGAGPWRGAPDARVAGQHTVAGAWRAAHGARASR
jgi:hypothetical protein